MKTIYLAQKKSGNFTVSTYADKAWTIIAVCNTPKELLSAVKSINPHATVIKAEYSQSQLKTPACLYSKKDALRAFDLSTSEANVNTYFN